MRDWCLLERRGRLGARHAEGTALEEGSMGMEFNYLKPRNIWGYQVLEESRQDFSSRSLTMSMSPQHLGFRLQASRVLREQFSTLFVILWQWPKHMNLFDIAGEFQKSSCFSGITHRY